MTAPELPPPLAVVRMVTGYDVSRAIWIAVIPMRSHDDGVAAIGSPAKALDVRPGWRT